jgi:hypothetical protein
MPILWYHKESYNNHLIFNVAFPVLGGGGWWQRMYCSDGPVEVPLNYKALYLKLTEDFEENILFV